MLVKPSDIRKWFKENEDLTGDDLANGDVLSTQLADHLNAHVKSESEAVYTRARLIMRLTAGLRQKLEAGSASSSEIVDATKPIDTLATEILRIVTGE